MCTRPDRASVQTSARALADAVVATTVALATLVAALLAAPVFAVCQRYRACPRPASIRHVDVQVHLDDPRCVAEVRRTIQRTLERTARTWAPLQLPIDRIVAGTGFSARGAANVYRSFPRTLDAAKEGPDGNERPLVVIILGLRDGERELEPAEIAAVLATQIEAVVAARYSRRSIIVTALQPPTANSQVVVGRVAADTDKASTRKASRSTAAPQPRGVADDEAEETSTEFEPSPLGHSSNGKAA